VKTTLALWLHPGRNVSPLSRTLDLTHPSFPHILMVQGKNDYAHAVNDLAHTPDKGTAEHSSLVCI